MQLATSGHLVLKLKNDKQALRLCRKRGVREMQETILARLQEVSATGTWSLYVERSGPNAAMGDITLRGSNGINGCRIHVRGDNAYFICKIFSPTTPEGKRQLAAFCDNLKTREHMHSMGFNILKGNVPDKMELVAVRNGKEHPFDFSDSMLQTMGKMPVISELPEPTPEPAQEPEPEPEPVEPVAATPSMEEPTVATSEPTKPASHAAIEAYRERSRPRPKMPGKLTGISNDLELQALLLSSVLSKLNPQRLIGKFNFSRTVKKAAGLPKRYNLSGLCKALTIGGYITKNDKQFEDDYTGSYEVTEAGLALVRRFMSDVAIPATAGSETAPVPAATQVPVAPPVPVAIPEPAATQSSEIGNPVDLLGMAKQLQDLSRRRKLIGARVKEIDRVAKELKEAEETRHSLRAEIAELTKKLENCEAHIATLRADESRLRVASKTDLAELQEINAIMQQFSTVLDEMVSDS